MLEKNDQVQSFCQHYISHINHMGDRTDWVVLCPPVNTHTNTHKRLNDPALTLTTQPYTPVLKKTQIIQKNKGNAGKGGGQQCSSYTNPTHPACCSTQKPLEPGGRRTSYCTDTHTTRSTARFTHTPHWHVNKCVELGGWQKTECDEKSQEIQDSWVNTHQQTQWCTKNIITKV